MTSAEITVRHCNNVITSQYTSTEVYYNLCFTLFMAVASSLCFSENSLRTASSSDETCVFSYLYETCVSHNEKNNFTLRSLLTFHVK